MVAVLVHQHLRDQGRRGHALGDQPLRCWNLMKGPAGPATVLGAMNAYHPE